MLVHTTNIKRQRKIDTEYVARCLIHVTYVYNAVSLYQRRWGWRENMNRAYLLLLLCDPLTPQ